MKRIVLLDSGPLGMIAHPTSTKSTALRCQQWAADLKSKGITVLVPGIADYEVRRSLLLEQLRGVASATFSIQRLDALRTDYGFDPITDATMAKASELWAQARFQNTPTAADPAIDGDMILCAHALLLAATGDDVEIATTNVADLALFVNANSWDTIVA